MRRTVRALLLLLVVLLLLGLGGVLTLFMARNAQWVVIRVPMLGSELQAPVKLVEYETPLALVMTAACGVGALLSALLFLPSMLRRAVERRRERRFIDDLEGELDDLRALPITGPAPLEDGPRKAAGRGGSRGRADPLGDEDLLMEALQEPAAGSASAEALARGLPGRAPGQRGGR